MMYEPAQKCENQAVFKQNYTLELLIALEMVYYCCFSLGGRNLDFPDFLQKSFITSTVGTNCTIVLFVIVNKEIIRYGFVSSNEQFLEVNG